MPRNKSAMPEDMGRTVNTAAIEADTATFDAENKRLAEIDAKFGDGLPYDRTRIVHETQFYLQQSAEAMLQAGNRLILLKEHEPHGDFMQALSQIGIAQRAAQKMMHAAVKFTGNKAALVNLGKTKMLELMAEDDDELEALAEGGTLAGHSLDEYERMTASDVRKALKLEREKRVQDTEVHEKLLSQKDTKINELHKKLETQDQMPIWPDIVNQALIDTSTSTAQALEGIDRLEVLRERIATASAEGTQPDADAHIETMAVTYLQQVQQLWAKAGELVADAEALFQPYADRATERALNAPE